MNKFSVSYPIKKILKPAISVLLLLLLNSACRKDLNSGQLRVVMTDAPAEAYEHVYIDLQQISVLYDGARNDMWIDLPTNRGIYDLLVLRNNLTADIVPESEVPIGRISQMRFILGNNNSVVVNGTSSDLKIPSAYTSGIKIKVNRPVIRNTKLLITLDFNAEKSIHQKGNGEYSMEPVIEVKSVTNY